MLIWNGSVPKQLAQCWFPRLAISSAKKHQYIFPIKYTEAVLSSRNCCGLKIAKCFDCSFLQNRFIVLFIIIFGTLSFPALKDLILSAQCYIYTVGTSSCVRWLQPVYETLWLYCAPSLSTNHISFIHCVSKICGSKLMAIILSNLNWFSIFPREDSVLNLRWSGS